MNTRLKKTLYESIMKSVAKTVKHKLNEYNETSTLIDKFSNVSTKKYLSNIVELLEELIGETIAADIVLPDNKSLGEFANKAITACIPHIVEATVCKYINDVDNNITLIQSSNKNDDKTYDIYLNIKGGNSLKIEVKAYLNGKTNNITLTDSQRNSNDDVIFIFVSYTVNDIYATIKNILIGTAADIKYAEPINNFKISRNGGKTSNMVSMRNNIDSLIGTIYSKIQNQESLDSKELRIYNKYMKYTLLETRGKYGLYYGTRPGEYAIAYTEVNTLITDPTICKFKKVDFEHYSYKFVSTRSLKDKYDLVIATGIPTLGPSYFGYDIIDTDGNGGIIIYTAGCNDYSKQEILQMYTNNNTLKYNISILPISKSEYQNIIHDKIIYFVEKNKNNK